MNRKIDKRAKRSNTEVNQTSNVGVWVGRGICAVVFVVPFLLWQNTLLNASTLPRYAVIEVGASILMTFLFFMMVRSKGVDAIPAPLLLWPVLGFFVVAVTSNLWAHHHGSALVETVHLFGMMLLFFLSLYVSAFSKGFPLLLLRISVLAGTAIASIGILQNFGWIDGLFFQSAPPAATMVNKNFCAQYLDTIIFPAWFLVIIAPNDREARRWAVCFCLILSLLFITYTRGAWLGLFIGLFVMFLYLLLNISARRDMMSSINRTKAVSTTMAVMFAGLIMALPSTVNNGTVISKLQDALQQAEIGSPSLRLAMYANTWQMFKDHPWGIGIGNWKHAYPEYSRAVRETPGYGVAAVPIHLHNDPFVFFVELGWIGGMFFISIFFVVLLSVWRISSDARIGSRQRLISLAMLLAITDVGVHSLVSFPFHTPTASMQIWLWLGVVGGIFMYTKRERQG